MSTPCSGGAKQAEVGPAIEFVPRLPEGCRMDMLPSLRRVNAPEQQGNAAPVAGIRIMGIALGLLLPFHLFALTLNAQRVSGVVLEEESRAPIAGAMVVLFDSDESIAARVLTDDVGRFAAALRHPGGYRARVDRIGYASLTTEVFDVPSDSTFRQILVPIRAVDLAGLDVSASRRCQLRKDVGEATVTVWEEARKALEAAAWTAESGQYSFTLLGFLRLLDRDGKDVLDEEREFASGSGQSTYESRPARELADSGYVRVLPDGNVTYFAPDAWVLLSEPFLETHCLRVQAGADSQVGLAFEPIEDRALPEIRGVLWMDAATATLDRLEFRYVNLPWGGAAGDAGGEVGFERLPAGTWIVRDWHIRMPLLESDGRSRYNRTGYQEKGGKAWRVTDPSGTVVREAATATVSGQATDSLGKKPLPGTVITARGVGVRAVSDSAGAFVLPGLPLGRIVLDVSHPRLDSLGLVALGMTAVNSGASGAEVAHVRVPGTHEALYRDCVDGRDGPQGTSSIGTILFGRVLVEGQAAAGSTVRVGWLSTSEVQRSAETRAVPAGGPGASDDIPVWKLVRLREQDWLETTLDNRGTFLLCDIASPSQVRVVATSGARTAEATFDIPQREPLRLLSVNLRSPRLEQRGVVHARVQDATTGAPIPAAIVSVIGVDDLVLVTSATDARGLASLPVLDSGTFRIRAERLGYQQTVSNPVRLEPGDTVDVELRLAPAPILLDSVLVSVRRSGRSLRAAEQLVFGRLLDDSTRVPIAGGTVRLLTGRSRSVATSTTNDQGQFWLISPQAGTYRLQGERIGYETSESPAVNLMLGDSIGVDFFLSTHAVLLAPITVVASRRAWTDRATLVGMEGFLSRYDRFAKSGFGAFLIRDSIAWWEARTRTAGNMLLARIPQVQSIVPYGDPTARELGGAVVMRGGRASGGRIQSFCIPQYYLDGAPVPYTVVSDLGPADLEAVEAYVSPQIPAEFATGFPCGVVAYWSRRTPDKRTGGRSVWSILVVAAIATASIILLR